MFWKIVKYTGAAALWVVLLPSYILLIVFSVVQDYVARNFVRLKVRRRFVRALIRLGDLLAHKCPICGGDMYEVDNKAGRQIYRCDRCDKEFYN